MTDARTNTEVLVIASPTIEHRRPGVGSLLMRLGAGAFVGLPALGLLLMTLWPPTAGAPSPLFGPIALFIFIGTFVAPALAIFGAILTAISFPFSSSGELRADDAGLIITRGKHEKRLGKERFDGGIVLPGWSARGKRPKIALHLKGGDVIYAELADGMTGYRVLDRLGIDPAKRRVGVALGSPIKQLVAGCLSVPLSSVFFIIPLGYFVSRYHATDWPVVVYSFCIFLAMLAVMRIARPTEVIIGNDGLRIRTPLRDQWLPYAQIRSVEEKDNALFVEVIRSGATSQRHRIAKGSADVMLALASRIRIAMALGSNGEGDSAVSQKLEPQGKLFDEWKRDLRALVATPGYRKTGISSDVLLSVVDDPDMPPGQRLGAAVALRFAEHREAQERIRIAADACADENVKRAFEEASTGELSERTLRNAVG